MGPEKSSLVWKHFVVNDRKKAFCKYCDKLISFHGKTSNLIKHLTRKHQEVLVGKQGPNHHEVPSINIPLAHVEEMKDENDFKLSSPKKPLESHKKIKLESAPQRVIVMNIDTACRICLTNLLTDSNSVLHVSLLSHFHQHVSYHEMFKVCTGIDLEVVEPQNVCHPCIEKLQSAYELIMQCTETQKILEDWRKSETEGNETLLVEEIVSDIETEFLVAEDNTWIHPAIPYAKSDCGIKSFKIDTSTTNVVEDNHGIDKPFQCEICGARASTKRGIGTHIKTQHLNFNLQCKYCISKYRSRIVLNSHIRRVHPEMKSPLKCEYCEYITPNFPNLFRHRLTHTREKLHKCTKCDRHFVTKDNLKTHEATHSDERPISCVICNSSFKTKKSLGVHMKIHREPDYECPVCRRGFLTNQLMRNHVARLHPEFILPPPGTILNKTWRIKKATRELKENVVRFGFDPEMIKSVTIDESYLNSSKKYMRMNKIERVYN